MGDEISRAELSGMVTSSRKQPWIEPRIETIEGREAHGSVFSYGGPDGGFYS